MVANSSQEIGQLFLIFINLMMKNLENENFGLALVAKNAIRASQSVVFRKKIETGNTDQAVSGPPWSLLGVKLAISRIYAALFLSFPDLDPACAPASYIQRRIIVNFRIGEIQFA